MAVYRPDSFYLGELWWVAARTRLTLGDGEGARRLQAEGEGWVRDIAERHVPDAFRASFLERNAVNRALLTWSKRPGPR